VVVWFHGGAWQSGAGALDWYSGAALAARGDVVVVSPNYRLGALGWLALPGETANLGLLDQEAALEWVAAHIEDFGGDPERVTVMGQSAGAMNIACLLMRKPRFQQAILQSASLGRGFRSLDKAHELAACFLKAAGANSVEAARQLPVQAWLDAQRDPAVVEWLTSEGAQRSLFGPVADGQILPLKPDEALPSAAAQVNVMVGYNQDEMAAFPGQGLHEKSRALGELIYGEPARQWGQTATALGRQAWFYRFDHRANQTFGACHCSELPFVFNTVSAFASAPMTQGILASDAERLTDAMQQAWISFIRAGDPGWPCWPQQMIFD
jgi:para-nitrobenzyl esterase